LRKKKSYFLAADPGIAEYACETIEMESLVKILRASGNEACGAVGLMFKETVFQRPFGLLHFTAS